MSKINYDDMTRRFLLGEAKVQPSVLSYVQSLSEIVNRMTPRTVREKRDIEIARQHLEEIKRHSKKLMEQVSVLEERLNVLEENKDK